MNKSWKEKEKEKKAKVGASPRLAMGNIGNAPKMNVEAGSGSQSVTRLIYGSIIALKTHKKPRACVHSQTSPPPAAPPTLNTWERQEATHTGCVQVEMPIMLQQTTHKTKCILICQQS